jgi:hypothetical protein
VDYRQFRAGYLEDTVGPLMKPGPRQVAASITMSQANGSEFDLEQWNGRYHGVFIDNEDVAPCAPSNRGPQLAVDNHNCDITVVNRWGGPPRFNLRDPPQWTASTLPIARLIAASTGKAVARPPGDQWPDRSVAFGVIWHTDFTEVANCYSATQLTRSARLPTHAAPRRGPVPPDPRSCAYEGGGGNYLSNESAYRNTLLRDRLNAPIAAGHIHTPDMQHFANGDLYELSDATFDVWRRAIVAQGQSLVHVVGEY